jgi:hypothetical protein
MKSYRVTNLSTGKTTAHKTYRQAQIKVAGLIASDVEGNVVRIAGPEGTVFATNNGLTISYSEAA